MPSHAFTLLILMIGTLSPAANFDVPLFLKFIMSGIIYFRYAYLILVSTAQPTVVYFFPAGVPFSTENAIKTAFSKVYSENININLHIFSDENIR